MVAGDDFHPLLLGLLTQGLHHLSGESGFKVQQVNSWGSQQTLVDGAVLRRSWGPLSPFSLGADGG